MYKERFKTKLLGVLSSPPGLVFAGMFLWYIAGLFITFEFNPMNWWLFTSWLGRIFALIILVSIFRTAFDDEV
jgi:hypothetical protein